jgi:hypothetical protein
VKILNADVRRAIDMGLGLRLNLGSGERHLPGFFNLDCVRHTNPDILADLNAPLSELPDNSVEAIYARHTLEHVERLLELLGELHRVTRPGGRLDIIVPHFSNPYGYSDPTHVRFFGLYSFHYFCAAADQPRRKVPNFYSPVRFRVESIRFNLLKESAAEKVSRAILQPFINRGVGWLDWYERRLCRLFPVNDVRYVLRPVKAAGGLQTGIPPAARAA